MEADRLVMDCELLEDFYSEHELCEQRYCVLERQLAWMDWIDGTLRDCVDAIRQFNLRPSRLWFYCLKRLIDPLLVVGFTLNSLFDRLRPDIVWVPAPRQTEPAWERFFRVGPHGRMEVPHFDLSEPARQIGAYFGAQTQVLSSASADAPKSAGELQRSGFRSMVRRYAPGWALDANALMRKFGPAGLRHLLPEIGDRGQPRLLVIRSGYDLDLLVGEAVGRGCQVDFWSRVERSARIDRAQEDLCVQAVKACSDAWPELEAQAAFREPFHVIGFDAYALGRSGLEHFVKRVIPEMIRYYLAGREVIRRGGYRAVLAPAAMRATALLAAARAERVPVVIFQHGGFVATCEHLMWDFADLAHADRLIVYGEGEKTYFDRRRRRYAERTAEVSVAGSARLEAQITAQDPRRIRRLRQTLEPDTARRLILYVATVTSGYSRLIAGESYPETLCFKRQVEVLELMRRYPNVTFIFKPYSDRDNGRILEMIARRGVENCRVVADVPLLQLMQASDAIAVEFPSTALLEAAASGKPLAVYADRESLRLDPAAADALREGALVAETQVQFLDAIRCLAENRIPEHMSHGAGRYTREYTLDLEKGPAARRAFDVLAQAAGL